MLPWVTGLQSPAQAASRLQHTPTRFGDARYPPRGVSARLLFIMLMLAGETLAFYRTCVREGKREVLGETEKYVCSPLWFCKAELNSGKLF